MPLYSYECPKCKTQVDLSRSIQNRDDAECQFCKTALKRLMTFKGTVWAPTAGGMK